MARTPAKRAFSSLAIIERDEMISAARSKIEESSFFLSKLREVADSSQSSEHIRHFGYYLSAFLSAARSAVQVLCQKGFTSAWTWTEPLIQSWSQRERTLHREVIDYRDMSVHVRPVEPGTQVEFMPLPNVLSRSRTRSGMSHSGAVFLTGLPSTPLPAVGLLRFFLEVDGKDEPAIECCESYLELVTRLVDERERTKNTW